MHLYALGHESIFAEHGDEYLASAAAVGTHAGFSAGVQAGVIPAVQAIRLFVIPSNSQLVRLSHSWHDGTGMVPKQATDDWAGLLAAPIKPAPIITIVESTQVIHRTEYFYGGRRRVHFQPDLMFSRLAGDWT